MLPKRMTANPVKPARYRAGKPLEEEASSSSDSGMNDDEKAPKRMRHAPPPEATDTQSRSAGIVIARGTGKITLPTSREEAAAQRAALEAMAKDAGFETDSEGENNFQIPKTNMKTDPETQVSSDEEGYEESDEEEGSEADESSSEDEAPRRLLMRPKFIPKHQREAMVAAQKKATLGASSTVNQAQHTNADSETQRQAQLDAMVEEQIRLRMLGRDAVYGEGNDSDVDTTDGLDPEAEFAAWKLRELRRLKRDRDELVAREREREETERRRNMTAAEREREDAEKLARQKQQKESRSKMSSVQKFHHRGAFFQDDAAKEGLLDRVLSRR